MFVRASQHRQFNQHCFWYLSKEIEIHIWIQCFNMGSDIFYIFKYLKSNVEVTKWKQEEPISERDIYMTFHLPSCLYISPILQTQYGNVFVESYNWYMLLFSSLNWQDDKKKQNKEKRMKKKNYIVVSCILLIFFHLCLPPDLNNWQNSMTLWCHYPWPIRHCLYTICRTVLVWLIGNMDTWCARLQAHLGHTIGHHVRITFCFTFKMSP